MELPNSQAAVVEDAKITDYLLNPEHPRGQSKTEFFVRFGFQRGQTEAFRLALLEHAATNPVVDTSQSDYGVTYIIEGPIQSPDGRDPIIRTVWQIDTGESAPRLITAYPR